MFIIPTYPFPLTSHNFVNSAVTSALLTKLTVLCLQISLWECTWPASPQSMLCFTSCNNLFHELCYNLDIRAGFYFSLAIMILMIHMIKQLIVPLLS